jgi:predicted CoA-binding protein
VKKRTVVLGATTNPSRYAYLAANRIKESGHELIPIGIRRGEVAGEPILDLREFPKVEDVDTITIYIGPANLKEWEEYAISLKPRRIIFNPGAENISLTEKAQKSGIETINACTLVMLSANLF